MTRAEKLSVSVVILATDEVESLKKTVDYLADCCSYKPDKIIVVLSRNATQNCVKACEFLKEKYKGYVEITVQHRDGIGEAVRYGIEQVKTTHMIFFPADMAIELGSIDRMVDLGMMYPESIIKTSRWMQGGGFVGYGRTRLVLNFLAQQFLKILFLTGLTDLTNPVQLIPVDYQRRIKWKEDNFTILIEQTIAPVRLGFDIKEVPAICFSRTEGKSKNSFRQTAAYLKTAIRVRFSTRKKLYK